VRRHAARFCTHGGKQRLPRYARVLLLRRALRRGFRLHAEQGALALLPLVLRPRAAAAAAAAAAARAVPQERGAQLALLLIVQPRVGGAVAVVNAPHAARAVERVVVFKGVLAPRRRRLQ
jgi:hypothetical protein